MQIAAGVLVFGDPLSTNPIGIAAQVCAFAMVCLSALLLPVRRLDGAAAQLIEAPA
jgi:hypothetical protein